MWEGFRVVCLIVCGVCSTASVNVAPYSKTLGQATSKEQISLKRFLQTYLRDRVRRDVRSTRYVSAFVDLRGDGGQDAIVYIMDDQRQWWCGSGGCTTLVLAPQGTSYGVVAYLTITWPPIRVLARESHGWHDIGVWMQGGGIQPGYEADLYFDGKTYLMRDKPTLRPSKRLQKRVLPGKVVIPEAALGRAKLLYPESHAR